ncbi:MAG: NADPH-dependent glutamate synthase [bacterium]|nr:NADPH-dependent glutamate synthase [bacterium]
MPENKLKKIPVREQPPQERIKNFSEVCLGYNEDEAIAESKRCIQCGLCIKGCPVGIDIPKFIREIREKNYDGSIKTLKSFNSLPAVCGRVCPQEEQCQLPCPLGKKGDAIQIGKLERFSADQERSPGRNNVPDIIKNNIKTAVIGSGPAGLTCAGELARMGYSVTLFESLHKLGGVLRYGIPEFRLPDAILDFEIDYIKNLGTEIMTNVLVGKTITVEQLFRQGYKAIFIGTGAGLPSFLNAAGENLNNIFSANEFLTRSNLMQAYGSSRISDTPIIAEEPVAVIGGGNVAMDSARTARRLGAGEVNLVYRRTEKEMPAREEEIEHAREEGVRLVPLTLPVGFIGDSQGKVREMKCIRMQLSEPDSSGRASVIPVPDSDFTMPVRTVIVAIGQRPNPLLVRSLAGLKLGKHGTIETDENMMSSVPGIFAGGDIVTGAATVILAMGMAKKAALGMDRYIRSLSS